MQGDGTLIRIPVMYGDIDRQVASIINQNSENTVNAAPRMALYISELALDRERLCDQTFIGKVQIRERAVENGEYTGAQGEMYTVERLMPTPFGLTVKVDIWSSSAEQKLQIIEQVLMLFNPSLEIQTSDNYLDWTSLSVVEYVDFHFSSREVPVGAGTAIDIGTLTLKTPIWISPPAKVKKMGIITKVITSIYGSIDEGDGDYIDGLGVTIGDKSPGPADFIYDTAETIGNYDIVVMGTNIMAFSSNQSQSYVSWNHIIEQYPGVYVPGLLKIFLQQPDGSEVVGYGTVDPLNEIMLNISAWDPDTYPANTLLPGPARAVSSYGSFDAVLDPLQSGPKNLVPGTRYLLLGPIGGGVFHTETTTVHVPRIVTNTAYNKVKSYTLKVDSIAVTSSTEDFYLYTDIPTVNISGVGYDALFDVRALYRTETYVVTIRHRGFGYQVNDKIKVRGSNLGGNDITNDCIIVVSAIGPHGEITAISSYGVAKSRNFIIIPDVTVPAGSVIEYELYLNSEGAMAWRNSDGSDFIAEENDIIEWDGSAWNIIMSAKTHQPTPVYLTNIFTLAQYKWTGELWLKSIEGEYRNRDWRMVL